MLDKDLGQEVVYTNIGELFQGLIDGYVLFNSHTNCRAEIIDSVLYINKKRSSSTFSFTFWEGMAGDCYRLYTRKKWFESIPEDGVLCWISDDEGDIKEPIPRNVAIIVKYYDDKDYPFQDNDTVCWRFARPFTEAETKKYLSVV